ncbi:hypothetical protein CP01DC11_1308B, partial [Chlamydia psittaci 01DC11]
RFDPVSSGQNRF